MIKKELKQYTVVVEALVPTTIKYKIAAENPEQAVDLVSKGYGKLIENPKQIINAAKKLKSSVYRFGTFLLEYTKKH